MEIVETITDHLPQTKSRIFFEELYEKAFPGVALFISKKNGSFEEARDIFHDALVIYYEKSTKGNLVVTVSPETYLLGIAKHLWIRKYQKEQKKQSLSAEESRIDIPADYYPTVNTNRLLQLLQNTGQKCLDLLNAFYHQKLSIKKITRALGYRNEHSASVQKYKCLEKLRETVKQNAISYEDFLE